MVCVHDKTLNQQCMLAQARPPMINHLTSILSMLVAIELYAFCTRTVNRSEYRFTLGVPFSMILVCISNSQADWLEMVHCLPGQAISTCVDLLGRKRCIDSVSWPNANRRLANYHRQLMP